ncbi:hypothetical protein LRS74_27480 [Streptomyces sp. LX-29]|uniref:hypothetical protein n=1 Tax=Streptomyces sp. LX-29 TaxID=2900152 RepID=UPI00240E279C|nr:hypothetical protein [Streptomyces sp. LX-29]WFB10362.1 hypothetical protein LRS74_27480 [Streptomyces sp. LX-29]
MTTQQQSPYLVEVAELSADSRYRVVHFLGRAEHTEPLGPEEFEPRLRQQFPGLDPHDDRKVHWADHPWEWPRWHPGEA